MEEKKRILAIDYGSKKCGLAVTDPLQISAHGLDTVDTINLWEEISHWIEEEKVQTIVLGEPLHHDGTPTQLHAEVMALVAKIKQRYPDISVRLEDESYTSSDARKILVKVANKKKRREKGITDKLSAVLILQKFLGHI